MILGCYFPAGSGGLLLAPYILQPRGWFATSLVSLTGGKFLLVDKEEGWKISFVTAGLLSLVTSILVSFGLPSSTTTSSCANAAASSSLPAVESNSKKSRNYSNEKDFIFNQALGNVKEKDKPSTQAIHPTTTMDISNVNQKSPVVSVFWTIVMRRPSFWILIAADVLVYFVTKAAQDWMMLYLMESGRMTQKTAVNSMFYFDTGSIFGGFVIGPLSDKLGGRRNITAFLYIALLCVCISPLNAMVRISSMSNDDGSTVYLMNTLLFFIGFFLAGPKTLNGINIREGHPEAAGAAGGALGLGGQLGSTLSGQVF
jgi:sugar phosphate permease